jgi:HEAT repeat protein
MTITRIVSTTFLSAVLAGAADAQPIGPGPVGPGPIGPGPISLGPGIGPTVIGPIGPIGPGPSASPTFIWRGPRPFEGDDRADELYSEGRNLVEEGRYDRALDRFNRLIALKSPRTDAALYWKAYSLFKLGQRADALTTIADLQKQFADSRWIKDAKALDVEVRQASGQPVTLDSQSDDELKLIVLNNIMRNDPDQAIPIIEKMLSSANSPKVKDRALFVLSQSRSARAREIITNIAKGNGNPDMQLRAIRYIGMMGGPESRQILADAYRTSNDTAVKREILRSFMRSNDRERLAALAKTETDQSLRADAVRQLGVIHGGSELAQLYQSESSVEIKKSILNAMFVGGDADKLIELAKNERDPELRKTAIHQLGLMKRPGTAEALTSIYASDASVDVRKSVVNALFLQGNATALVALARAERNPEMKKDIVSKLSNMKSKEATDYLLELLK